MVTWRHVTALAFAGTLATNGALAHPHIFAEARLEVALSDDGTVKELRHVWRFDELFSSTVMLEFDANTNLELEPEELQAIGETVKASLADFDYYTSIKRDGADLGVSPPEQIFANFENGQLLMFFAVKPAKAAPLDGTLSFGVYDPTMYAAIDFVDDSDLVVLGDRGTCESEVVRPDPDQVLAENQSSLTDAFFNDPGGNDISSLFATRLELSC
ncbi:DUF1007 family protein [Pararhizobium haloflavum]|uniref:DUF1007 family protein n=1 Tax=Pararhizobium haloflavum TaxID=2037914 RepID=UPI000C186C8E|nr:DUF1007 family protein [Pararhizobium haloflavum]